MDEYINFHPLAYGQPNFHLAKFSEGYQAYLKKGPWGISTPFPFPYTGNLQAALFYPFYVFFPLLWAKTLYGIWSLCLIYWSFFRCFQLNRAAKIFLVLFLPLYVAVMHDGGPVNVAILVFLWTKIWIEKLYQSSSRIQKIGTSGLLAFMWAIAFYDKIFFLYIWPAAIVFAFARLGFAHIRLKTSYFLIGSIGFFLVFVFVFMQYDICAVDYNSMDLAQLCLPEAQFLGGEEGQNVLYFLKQCYHGNFSFSPLHVIFEDRKIVFWLMLHQVDFSFYLLRNVDYYSFFQVKLFGLQPFLAWAFVIMALERLLRNPLRYLQSLYLISGLVMILVFMSLGKIRFGHHTIFLWIPLIGFLTEGPSPPFRQFIFYLFWGINSAFLLVNIIFGNPHSAIREGYARVAAGTQRSDIPRAIVNFDDWNYYYIRSLDNNRNDIVTWVKPDQAIAAKRLFALSDSLDLPIVYVGSRKAPIPLPKGFTKRLIQSSVNNPIYLISNSSVRKRAAIQGQAKSQGLED
ncbi:MAG: hypothetical protein RIS68_42 [Bacteroidota bacterium]